MEDFCWSLPFQQCFLGGSKVKNPSFNAGAMGSIPGWEDPLEKEMARRSSIFLPRQSHGQRAWQTTVHGVTKSRTQPRD